MADSFQALSKIAIARSGGQPAFVSTGSTTSALTGNLSVSGLLTGGTVTSQFASQTQAFTSTLSGNQLTFASGSINSALVSTMSVGTILNFSAGGSIGTSLYLSGTLATPFASISSGMIGALIAGSLNASTITSSSIAGNLASLSTLTVGTILNLNIAGTLGTNLTLTGTLVTSSGSISSTAYAATLSVGSILNFLQGQTVSTSGTIAGSFLTDTVAFPGSGIFAGSLSTMKFTTGTLATNLLSATIVNIIGTAGLPGLMTIVGGSGTAANQLVLQGYNHPTPAAIMFNTVGASAGTNLLTTRILGRDDGNSGGVLALQTALTDRVTILNNGLIGINNTTPAYQCDISGSCRVSGYFYSGNRSVSFKYVYGNGISMASGANLLSFSNYDSSFPYTTISNGHFVCPVAGLYLFSLSLGFDYQTTTTGGAADLYVSRSSSALTSAPAATSNTAVFCATETLAPAYSVQRVSCVAFCNSGDHIQGAYNSTYAFKSYTWGNTGCVNYMTGILLSAA